MAYLNAPRLIEAGKEWQYAQSALLDLSWVPG